MPDPALVYGLVLLAALIHATWNALIKASDDPWLTTAVLFGSGSFLCALALPFFPLPSPDAWPWLLTGAAIHNVYLVTLLLSYRYGDLSHVYPIARGTGPLLVALLSERVIGERLSATEVAGTALVSVGILSLALDRSLARPDGRRAAGFAVLTGIWIAAYTIVDGMGVRTNGSAGPLSYLLWLQALEAVPFVGITLLLRGGEFPGFLRRSGARAAVGGVMATTGYSIVLWAYSLAAIAPIAALRETSVILAAVIGTTLLGEPFGSRRVVAAIVVAVGVVVLGL